MCYVLTCTYTPHIRMLSHARTHSPVTTVSLKEEDISLISPVLAMKCRKILKGHRGRVLHFDWSPDKSHVLTAGQVGGIFGNLLWLVFAFAPQSQFTSCIPSPAHTHCMLTHTHTMLTHPHTRHAHTPTHTTCSHTYMYTTCSPTHTHDMLTHTHTYHAHTPTHTTCSHTHTHRAHPPHTHTHNTLTHTNLTVNAT